MQSLFPGNSLLKGKGPKEQEDQDEVVPNSGKKSSKRRVIFGSGSNKKAKKKKVLGGNGRFVAGRSNVAVNRNIMSVELNHQVPGRGKRTVRKRPERNDEDNYRLVSRMADIVKPTSEEDEEEQTFRGIDQDWAGETPGEMDEEWASETPNRVMTPMQVDGESDDNSVGVQSEDDDDEGQFVSYSQRNKWGFDWNSNPNEAMEDVEEEEVAGVEQVQREYVAEMSESSEDEEDDDLPAASNNAAANNYDRESEDYSSSDS